MLRPLRDDLAGRLAARPPGRLRGLKKGLADHPARVTVIQGLHRQVTCRVELGAVQRHLDGHIMLEEARNALGKNRDEQRHQKCQRNADGDAAVNPETPFTTATGSKAGGNPFGGKRRRHHLLFGVTHIALCIS